MGMFRTERKKNIIASVLSVCKYTTAPLPIPKEALVMPHES